MRSNVFRMASLLALASMPLLAQRDGSFRASIKGNGNSDSGKCTIEVRVDGAAEVEFSGDTGYLRTLAGAPAQWTRIDCSAPMPRGMNNFKFSGVDGRGSQNLISDPRNNRGVAIVRIEDPKNGTEGYTFDLEWSGGRGGYSTDGGSGNGSGYGNGNGGGRNRNRDRDRGGSGNGYTVNCASDNGSRRYCNVDTRDGVRLVRQYGEGCRQGDTWGYDDRGIWVDRGCKGEFQIGR